MSNPCLINIAKYIGAALCAAVLCACAAGSSPQGAEPQGQAQILSGEKEPSAAVQFVDREALASMAGEKNAAPAGQMMLTYRGAELPYDKETNTFYLSVALPADSPGIRERLLKLRTKENASVFLPQDLPEGDVSAAVQQGRAFPVLIRAEEKVYEASVILTGLPTISVQCEDGTFSGREEHSGTLSVIDGERDSEGKWFCAVSLRGSTSLLFDKKSYDLELHDRNGGNAKVPLLGMRSDDDWVLNAMSSDKTLSREKVCYKLWEEVNRLASYPVASSRIEYAELFLDGEYAGVYGLMEPVDKKLMDLREGDILYKIKKWRDESELKGELTQYNGSKAVVDESGYEYAKIIYPEDDPAGFTWDILQSFERFALEDRDLDALGKDGIDLHAENFLTHNLFCVLAHAEDNTWKNLLLICRRQPDGTYMLYETIWDLNYSFGDVFRYDFDRENVIFDPGTTASMRIRRDMDFVYCALLEAVPSVKQQTAALWQHWRSSGISAEHVCEMFRENEELLTLSGALARERERWQTGEDSGSLAQTCKWVEDRFRFLDQYYGYME